LLIFVAKPPPNKDVKKRAATQVLNVYGIFSTGNKVFNDHIKASGAKIIDAITNTINTAIRNSFIYLIFYITIPKDQAITVKI
jgi:hypothetical protein